MKQWPFSRAAIFLWFRQGNKNIKKTWCDIKVPNKLDIQINVVVFSVFFVFFVCLFIYFYFILFIFCLFIYLYFFLLLFCFCLFVVLLVLCFVVVFFVVFLLLFFVCLLLLLLFFVRLFVFYPPMKIYIVGTH